MEAVSFTEQLYILSHIKHTRDSITPPYPHFYSIGGDRSYAQNLRLTDGIALLLSVADKSDKVAGSVAVTYELTQKGINFFYSGNRPYTPAEKIYIERLVDIVKDTPPREKCTEPILHCAIPECQVRIMARLGKIQDEIRALKPPGSDGIIPVYPSVVFETFMQGQAIDMVPDGLPIDRFLGYYLDSLSEVRNVDNVAQIVQSMQAAYSISTAPDVETVLPYKGLRKRLKKFGEYFLAAVVVSRNTSESTGFFRVKDGMTFTEVTPSDPCPITITDSLANILSSFSNTRHPSPFTVPYPAHPQPVCVTTFIHPEITLATFMISRRLASAKRHNAPVSDTIEIGMTKSLCWLCKAYLHRLQSENLFTKVMEVDPTGIETREVRAFHVVVSRYDSKIKAEWRMPEESGDEIREHIEYLVANEVESLVEDTQCKLQPLVVDSQPVPVERKVFGEDEI